MTCNSFSMGVVIHWCLAALKDRIKAKKLKFNPDVMAETLLAGDLCSQISSVYPVLDGVALCLQLMLIVCRYSSTPCCQVASMVWGAF